MQKIRLRVAWTLAAAGALSVTGATPTAPTTPVSTGSPVSTWRGKNPPSAAAMVPLSPSHACLVEMQIEIAWLADPMTFPYPMAACLVGGTLEVAGLVPSEAVRQRALYLARECSGMSVADRLHVQAGMPEPGGREPDGVLARKAAE